MREHWIFVEFIQKHALTNIYFMQKVRKGKKNINNEKKMNRACRFVKEKKRLLCCVHYMPNCSSCVSFGKKGPVLIQNG